MISCVFVIEYYKYIGYYHEKKFHHSPSKSCRLLAVVGDSACLTFTLAGDKIVYKMCFFSFQF